VHALLFAILLIGAVIFLPQGFGGAVAQVWRHFGRRPDHAGRVTKGSPP
jgi:hypothetical protein